MVLQDSKHLENHTNVCMTWTYELTNYQEKYYSLFNPLHTPQEHL